MQFGQRLESLMQARQLTQDDVAVAAGVSQATVSRVLRRQPQRSGAAYLRLCSYIQAETVPENGAPAHLIAAVRRTWDGSERHAAALAELIDASGRLWPDLADSEERPSTAPRSSAPG
jgi:transcriptional regulator with XRE-family HTH domain